MSHAQNLVDEHTVYVCDNAYAYKAAVAWGECKREALAVLERLEAAGVLLHSISSHSDLTVTVWHVTNIRKVGAAAVAALEELGYPTENWKTEDTNDTRTLSCAVDGKLLVSLRLYPDGDKCKFKVASEREEIRTVKTYILDCPEDEEEVASEPA